ncbi:MucB/RseB C-terminal domain-containing protein [Pseudomonas sp. nanlin1]|uniref:MucB/RseB C-terminal domain-containing protein n=1 Tax=Pseudomonas sp. nanlin1 TaxID=3040605 RepID=UPI00388DDEB4
MRALPLTALVLGGCLSVAAHAEPDASQWLNRMAKAEQLQSYQGTFVYDRSGSFSTHDIWHLVQNGKVSERVLQMDGAPLEIVRSNDLTQCVTGSLDAGVDSAPKPSERKLDPLKLMSWYDLSVAGTSRVAGREAVVVKLAPKDQYRFGFEWHLDKASAVLLKSLLLDEKSRLLERFQFTRLNPVAPTPAQLQPSADCKPIAIAAPGAASPSVEPALAPWHAEWLPAGFELVQSHMIKGLGGKGQVTRLLYDDGLSRFSVFVESLNGTTSNDIRTQVGPTAAVSRRLTTPSGELMVTVVGEIPLGTAERIALSMRERDGAASR